MKKRILPPLRKLSVVYCSVFALTFLVLVPHPKTSAAANDICANCHGASLKDIHHRITGIQCGTCHQQVWDPVLGAYVTATTLNCIQCHEFANFHIAAHDVACPTCHVLEDEDGDGILLNIHNRVRPKSATICADCHRYNDPNAIFTRQVKDRAEQPDYDYPVQDYLYGPCTKCHANKTHMGSNGDKGCLPCHFAETPNFPFDTYSYPSPASDFYGSQTWGHNFQKRNNPDKTVGGKK